MMRYDVCSRKERTWVREQNRAKYGIKLVYFIFLNHMSQSISPENMPPFHTRTFCFTPISGCLT